MPQLQFESLGQSLSRLPQVIQTIPDIIRNPSANPLQAAVLLTIAVVLILIVLLSIILVFVRPPSEELEYREEGEAGAEAEEGGTAGATPTYVVERTGLGQLTLWSLVLVVVATVWVATGISTSRSDVCTSCHDSTVHGKTSGTDPHGSVQCVECHESGGPAARVTVNVFTRVQHVILARIDSSATVSYGLPVSSDACQRCHRRQIAGTYTDATLGVRVSHKEPLAAGASCVDCHTLQSGVVSAATVGMSPCLRCHDGKHAKSACSECHQGDPSRAIRPTVAVNSLASVQVPNPVCTGCHKDMSKCDACHGLRMPHSPEFMAYGHALPAARAIWSNNLQLCLKCHYAGHNSCQQPGCHAGTFPSHGLSWKQLHKLAFWPSPYDTGACACHGWNPVKHQGVVFCQICHPVKPKNAKP